MALRQLTHPLSQKKQRSLKRQLLFFAVRKYLEHKKQLGFSSANIAQDVATSFWLTARYFWLHSIVAIALSAILFGATYTIHDSIFKDLPTVAALASEKPATSTKILDRNGEVLFKIYSEENRTIIPLAEIPKSVIFATIAIEDKDFYNHHGFSIRGIVRAVYSNSQGNRIQGGSTITQQLVKNRLLTPQRTLSRKVRELLLSILTEIGYSKDEILEMYLNQVAYGGAAYGIQEAAQKYFLKNASELTLAESAFLAGLPVAPSVYTPFGSNPELAFARQEEVLRRMLEDGYITEEQLQQAKRETLVFSEDKINIRAPHFTMYVRKLLADQYGEQLLNTGGLIVRTTLDLQLQEQAEKIVSAEVAKLGRLRVTNGAAIITQPNTGEILAMVGSANYFNFAQDGQVNVVIRPRQPGSSIKPVTYALALENGETPQSWIDDSPITYHVLGSPPYSPKNYDGTFRGKVTFAEALASSYNIPAVKLLAKFGINNMIDLAEDMGITTWQDRSRLGLSLTLGGGEVTLHDMAEVYGTFANVGKHADLHPILEIVDQDGTIYYRNECVLEQKNCADTQVITQRTALTISSILSDNKARSPAFGQFSALAIPNQQVAVKTGTTNSLRDNWTLGYTQNRVVGVWVGNNDNTPMSAIASGVTGASPIWNQLMRLTLDAEKPHVFPSPAAFIRQAQEEYMTKQQ